MRTIKKNEEWTTNYGRDYWLRKSVYNSLDTKTRKICRDFYGITVDDLFMDEESSDDEDDKNANDGAGQNDSSSDSSLSGEEEEEDEV